MAFESEDVRLVFAAAQTTRRRRRVRPSLYGVDPARSQSKCGVLNRYRVAIRLEPKNEVELCERVIAMLAARLGTDLEVTERPDQSERNEEAVEMVCTTGSGQSFALEHTRIESFTGQIGDGFAFSGLLEPLEDELKGRFAGTISH
jgi:hypothetical protein